MAPTSAVGWYLMVRRNALFPIGLKGPALELVILAMLVNPALGQGIYISAAGPTNRGTGGASVAAPLDALGAMYWNPASIGGLESSELAVAMELVRANHQVASSVGAFGGSSDAENGWFPVPSVAWVHHPSSSALTVGLGLNSVAGFKTNLIANPANPVLAPPPTGLGRVSSEASFMQFAPAIAMGLSKRVWLGVGPVVTLGQVAAEPFVLASPNSDGRYSPARATRYHWGGGAQVGIFYIHDDRWRFGASVKTPIWMQTLRFYGEDAGGGPRVLSLDLDLPLIVSAGTAYYGLDKWILALDVRYLDYASSNGFGDPAQFDGTAALQGLGWRSTVAVAVGAQRRLSTSLSLRAGYAYNESPVDDRDSFFNLASPLIYRHTLSAGGSLRLSRGSAINLAYSYFLPEDVTGPIISPVTGPVPGSSVRNSLHVHVLSLGISARY